MRALKGQKPHLFNHQSGRALIKCIVFRLCKHLKNHTRRHLFKVAARKKRQVKQACKGRLLIGDSLERLKEIPDASIDSIVTDPPYELGFMGKAWDGTGIAYNVQLWSECLRVLKPGGHLLAFGGTRTYHRMAVAIEDAGFEIRDSIHWVYGSGFPKSLDVSKAIDKQRDDRADITKVVRWLKAAKRASGVTGKDLDREFGTVNVSQYWFSEHRKPAVPTLEQVPQLLKVLGVTADDVPEDIRRLLWELNGKKGQPGENWAKREVVGTKQAGMGSGKTFGILQSEGSNSEADHDIPITAPATDAAKKWQGWGTALKPAHEPIVLARKPLTGTVAANVLEHGTGALNIDGCRIGNEKRTNPPAGNGRAERPSPTTGASNGGTQGGFNYSPDTEATVTSGRWPANIILDEDAGAELDAQSGLEAARFFYCPKPSKKERNAGLDGLPETRHADRKSTDGVGGNNPRNRTNQAKQNFHPTVKPLELIRYLTRLVTPPDGTVLDPFMGSGTTAVAATLEGFNWKGCEMTEDYLQIIKARIKWAEKQKAKEQPKLPLDGV